MVKDNKTASKIAKDFTKDLKGLYITLQENCKFLYDRKTKIKLTKIMKQLRTEFAPSLQDE